VPESARKSSHQSAECRPGPSHNDASDCGRRASRIAGRMTFSQRSCRHCQWSAAGAVSHRGRGAASPETVARCRGPHPRRSGLLDDPPWAVYGTACSAWRAPASSASA
jgi:hypothetical protein